MARLIPAVEIAGEVELVGAGRPLPVDPASVHPVEAEVVVGVGKLIEGTPLGKQAVLGSPVEEHSKINVACVSFQLGV